MLKIKRGDIVLAELEESQCMLKGLHPCLVISNYEACSKASLVQIIPITSKNKSQATHVEIDVDCGLNHKSILLCEQLGKINQSSIRNKIGKISYDKMLEVKCAIEIQLGLKDKITNKKDINEIQEMVENIKELDRFLIANPQSVETQNERKLAIRYLKIFCVTHGVNNLNDYYSEI